MTTRKKAHDDNKFITEFMGCFGGYWACKLCSDKNWTVSHPKTDLVCPKTGKLREEAEFIKEIDGYKG